MVNDSLEVLHNNEEEMKEYKGKKERNKEKDYYFHHIKKALIV